MGFFIRQLLQLSLLLKFLYPWLKISVPSSSQVPTILKGLSVCDTTFDVRPRLQSVAIGAQGL